MKRLPYGLVISAILTIGIFFATPLAPSGVIGADQLSPGFAYSIGLYQKFHHPEVICIINSILQKK